MVEVLTKVYIRQVLLDAYKEDKKTFLTLNIKFIKTWKIA